MSDPNSSNGQQTPPRLTQTDPVSQDQLKRLQLLQESHTDIAVRFLTLENEKVKLLAASRRLDDEKQRIFESILIERGLAPDVPVEIDATNGQIRVLSNTAEPAQPPAPPAPPQTPQQPPPSA